MNDETTPASTGASVPGNFPIAQLEAAAEAATAGPGLRERVRDLTEKALQDRSLSFGELREIVSAITSGVGTGLTARGSEIRDGLKQAVSGLDEAIGSAAQAASYTLQEAVTHGKAYKDNELKAKLEQLRDLESQIVDTLKQTARESGGKVKEELELLSEHLKNSGTRTGSQVRDALQQMASGVRATGAAGRAGLAESAGTATERLSQVASGILAALSDSLKRQSERLGS